jgi:hypothetical protein
VRRDGMRSVGRLSMGGGSSLGIDGDDHIYGVCLSVDRVVGVDQAEGLG